MSQPLAHDSECIAIIGMAGRFPGASNLDVFWRNLRDGVESIVSLSDEEVLAEGIAPEVVRHPRFVKAGAILENADLFDAQFFGYSPREASALDPQQRLFLECAWHALEDAGCDPERYSGPIGMFAGSAMSGYLLHSLPPGGTIDFATLLANDKDFTPTRASYKLNLKGPSVNVQTACSTSLVAVHMACQSLLTGACDMALAGGVAVHLPQKAGYLYEEESILSPDGHCRAFDAQARGVVTGNGLGIVVLKRLADALADRDRVRAVIRGSAINNDGSLKIGFTAPSVEGQAEVVAAAHAIAGVDPRHISYVEAHGTGTLLGDPIEVAALTQAFRMGTAARGFCGIGSVKTNIGHLDAAAGVTGLIKTVLSLENRLLPPSLHFEKSNPQIDFSATPFYVVSELQEWRNDGKPRIAGVSSFGIGGTNAHIVVEEGPAPQPASPSCPWQLLTLSAKSEEALEAAAANLANHLKGHPEEELADVAYTLHTGRHAFEYRLAIVAGSRDAAVDALEGRLPERVSSGRATAAEDRVAFLFPGGGAQHVNMGRDLYEGIPHFREQVEMCCRMLEPQLGLDLRTVIYPPREREAEAVEQLRHTALGLPALFVIEYALASLWISWGIRPAAMIGHSVGEYTAACIAGVFPLQAALDLVALRGRLMQTLPGGGMLAISRSEAEVRALLGGQLEIAAVNSPRLCVASGSDGAIERAAALLVELGIDFHKVAVDVAAHSEKVDPILQPFLQGVRKVRASAPRIPFVSTLTGTWVTGEQATEPEYWMRHMRHTVRFSDGLGEILVHPERVLLEVGPGHTLGMLASQHPGKREGHRIDHAMRHLRDEQADEAVLLMALGRLWTAGLPVDWDKFHAGGQRQRISLPSYPFERRRYWIKRAEPLVHTFKKNPEISRWFYLPSWKRSLPLARAVERKLAGRRRTWLFFDDNSWFAALAVKRLRNANQDVVTVRAGGDYQGIVNNGCSIRPDCAADYRELVDSLKKVGRAPERILHLWNVSREQAGFETHQLHGHLSLMFLAQALEGDECERRWFICTSQLFDATGSDVVVPDKATLLGPALVIPQEFPQSRSCVIDLDDTAEPLQVDRLMAELGAESSDFAIAFRGRDRLVRAYEPVPLESAGEAVRSLRDGGVYLITGGFGGVGLLLAQYLARTRKARLVLLGRTLPSPEKLKPLEDLGAEVLLLTADVACEDQMRAALDAIDTRFGELHGVLHAAGVTSGPSILQPIGSIGPKESEMQFRPKVQGVLMLEKLLSGRALDFCVLFSSNASVLGGLGFAAYAAANQFMDSFAALHGGPWISATWDGWLLDESARPEAMQTSMDEYSMSPAESCEAFRRVVTLSTTGNIVVSTGDLAARLDIWVNRRRQTPEQVESVEPAYPRPKLRTSYVEPRNETEAELAAIWRQFLGLEQLGVMDNFFNLGGHSLLGTQIMSRVRDTFAVDLPLRSLFETRTVAALAEQIEQRRAELLLAEIEGLDQGQIAEELARRMKA